MEQQLLPTFEPSEADMVQMALNQPLEDKIRRSIGFIQQFEKRSLSLNEKGIRVADSFGKDSCVIRYLHYLSGIKYHCVHSLTTMDPPELIKFGRIHHPDTIINKYHTPMIQLMIEKGKLPPTRIASWCCDVYKHNFGKNEIVSVGVRVSESKKREKFWKQLMPRQGGQGAIIAPILYWTDENVWTFIKSNNIPYCELYDQGCKRLGCVGCPKNGKSRINEFKRWPKYEKRWHDGIVKTWEKWRNIPRNDGNPRAWSNYDSGEDAWKWWMEQNDDLEEGCTFDNFMSNV